MKICSLIVALIISGLLSTHLATPVFSLDDNPVENNNKPLIDVLSELKAAGYDTTHDWCRSFESYFMYGSSLDRRRYQTGDQFTKNEVTKKATSVRAKLQKGNCIVHNVKLTRIVQRSDIETRGLVTKLALPFRVRAEEPLHECTTTGLLASLHPSDFMSESIFFLTKDKTLLPCTSQEAFEIKKKLGGVLYHPESTRTNLTLIFQGDMERLKHFARTQDEYSIDLLFTDSHLTRPPSWGFFETDMLIDNNWDTEKICLMPELLIDDNKPGYFKTSILGGKDESKIPELINTKLLALKIYDKNGKTIGGFNEALVPARKNPGVQKGPNKKGK